MTGPTAGPLRATVSALVSRSVHAPAIVVETRRLTLRRLTLGDAAFICTLLNEPSFLRHIGDKGVRTEADAAEYILAGPMTSYDTFGFGLYCVALRDTREPVGICGLLKREALDDVDVGFAFLPPYWSKGYASEAAAAVMAYAYASLGLRRLVAIAVPHNESSIALLGKLGFAFERMVRLAPGEEELRLFGTALDP